MPLIEFEDGRRLAKSNAMLIHLAEGTSYLPADKFDRAKAYEWLFFEQYSHEPAIAVRISILTAPERAHMRTPERLEQLLSAGNYALGVMETRLAKADWLGGQRVFDRRHSALRLHASRGTRRLRSLGLSRRQRLARPGCRAAGPRADRMAAARLKIRRAIAHLFAQALGSKDGHPNEARFHCFRSQSFCCRLRQRLRLATPAVDARVPPAEIMNEIDRIVRREFYDRDGLDGFQRGGGAGPRRRCK